ncbi:MAG: DUF4294 domain-containing protein [Saprospiraceae bacterium]|nr:DUF4294 domain-containing protein [Saprospiraceae bacterium]MCB9321673.1 DUF4294 domain-containing protein [Lewinellaceae bacterium]
MRVYLSFLVLIFGWAIHANGQIAAQSTMGPFYTPMPSSEPDTLYIINLESVSISAPRSFADNEEFRRYQLYRRYALKVYPYAVKAIQVYQDIKGETDGLKRRKQRRYVNDVHKQMKDEFTETLKNLSRTQGHILISMIENELDVPIYEVIKELKGGATATYWSTLGKLYGYALKDKYEPGKDPILDLVLQDFDINLEEK